MEVIAQSGTRVLVQLEERDPERPLKLVPAVVVDMRRGKVYPPKGVDTILAHGYWEPFDGDPEPVLVLLRRELRPET